MSNNVNENAEMNASHMVVVESSTAADFVNETRIRPAPVGATAADAGPVSDGDILAKSAAATEARQEALRRQAFAALPFSYRGKQLHAFTRGRWAFFHAHRDAMRAGQLADIWPSNSAFALDAARILYLCSHEPSQWNRILMVQPEGRVVKDEQTGEEKWEEPMPHLGLEDAINEWAEVHIGMGVDENVKACDLAREIYQRAITNRAVVKAEDGFDGEETETGK